MPEGVEVALTALYLNNELAGKRITGFTVSGGRYSKKRITGLNKLKLPVLIKRVDSKGKLMWFELDHGVWLVNRFGLEGEWGFEEYKHSDVQIMIDDKRTLYFTDPMHYGTIEIVDSEEFDRLLNRLGPDLLKTPFTNKEFYDRLRHPEWKIVKLLMTQTKDGIGSGLGNYLAAESLFRARISPHTTVKQLLNDRRRVYRLADAIRFTIKLAFSNSNIGYLDHLPRDMANYLKRIRRQNMFLKEVDVGDKQFVFNVYRQKKYNGYDVVADKIIPGRSTYWVRELQK